MIKYKLYYRVGMIHFSVDSDVSGGLSDKIAKFSGELFRKYKTSGLSEDESVDVIGKLRVLFDAFFETGEFVMSRYNDTWFEKGEEEPGAPVYPECWLPEEKKWYLGKQAALVERYGESEGKFLMRQIALLHRTYDAPCKDNERLCLVGDKAEEEAYWGSHENGCCGFVDRVFVYDNSENRELKVFRYGFNFGH